jgi:hypothetical protein
MWPLSSVSLWLAEVRGRRARRVNEWVTFRFLQKYFLKKSFNARIGLENIYKERSWSEIRKKLQVQLDPCKGVSGLIWSTIAGMKCCRVGGGHSMVMLAHYDGPYTAGVLRKWPYTLDLLWLAEVRAMWAKVRQWEGHFLFSAEILCEKIV